MKAREFVKYIEGYYGPYKRPLIRQTVQDWAASYTGDLMVVARLIVETYSTTWGRVPDLAKIRDIMYENRDQLHLLQLPDGAERTKQITAGEFVDREEGQRLIREVVERLAKRKRVEVADAGTASTGDRGDRVRGDAAGREDGEAS